ncbi:uncharacterized protein G2W53_026323 [Senna tora]|uniref:Uncharacterized protein n=1 Tax=Senna tora TaxID=362788 RepID=A0A834TEY8_9FABA|nr:uncharacterized protein G2W53_026323 [Senna tora]
MKLKVCKRIAPSHTHAVKLLFDATSVLQLNAATRRHNSTPQLDASLQPSTLQLDDAVRERTDAGAVRGSINASAVREGESFWLSRFSFLVLAFDFFPNRFSFLISGFRFLVSGFQFLVWLSCLVLVVVLL